MAKIKAVVNHIFVFGYSFRGTATLTRNGKVVLETEFWTWSPERVAYKSRTFREKGCAYSEAKTNLKEAVLAKVSEVIDSGALSLMCSDGPWPAYFRNREREQLLTRAFA